jgi:hypothetical protein
MNAPEPAAGPPSRSAVRRGGDHYQDLISWGAALRIIQLGTDITQLEIEIIGAGNIDDIVLRQATHGDRFSQVKWATTTALTVDDAFMIEQPARGKSLLQKLYASYQKLHDPARPPTLELLTNRNLDPTHPLLGHVDGRTDLLVPYAANASLHSPAGQQLAAWAEHLGVSGEQLLEMLSHLIFRTGLTISSERDRAQVLMLAAGLRHDDDALSTGVNAVADWIRGGRRVVQPEDVHDVIDKNDLRAGDPRAVLLVQAIDRDPHPEDATEMLDWVDMYDGDSPSTRCQPRDRSGWSHMADDLAIAGQRLEAAGLRSILVRGALRQATFFLVGASLPAVRGTTLSYLQNRELWSTDAQRIAIPTLERKHVSVGAGPDLAVAVGVAIDPTNAVVNFVRSENLPISNVITLAPAEGAHDQAIGNAGEAVAYAQSIRDAVRDELETHPNSRQVHLFLAGPGGLALLLGHRWNRTRPTIVYEHLGAGRGYTSAFKVEA